MLVALVMILAICIEAMGLTCSDGTPIIQKGNPATAIAEIKASYPRAVSYTYMKDALK